MFEQFFAESELLTLPLIAMLMFFAFFLLVIVRVVFGMRDKKHMDRMAALPLDDDSQPPEAAR